ncbi:hypothetical protein PSCICO_21650 [Pseudomonas cichorii]|uniref:Secreted protein n=2 Tax=Pseudomonas syringae group TaxID=136849 RepID=A0A3M4VIB6_PSECI|nr:MULTISPECIES: hypothetical protein [Pseudomonas]AHF68456.1 hypothetical protein PCH70_33030 [Pseudomonas cichorii JBC1]MDO7926316.1 hypothetical protein [Pseudomonas sp. KFB-138]QVE15468.1 hypothetical protein KGD89_16380 [Pseudomonas cichorii]RMR51353.1 hypothetical protein ALP84_02611 [Pseudomonas cichorii]SDO16863.1 hypothetical protein SAMN05216599_106135 [Pseudomonas cichorii]
MLKKTFLALFATAVLATTNAYAACINLNINRSGSDVYPQGETVVYGPYTTSCAATQTFRLQDLSSRFVTNNIKHIFEKQNGATWTVISSTTSYGGASLSFYAPTPGTYRYRIENVGTTPIANWTASGRISI